MGPRQLAGASVASLPGGRFERLVRDVVPEILETVVLARLGCEDVDDDVAVVADDPARLRTALDGARQHAVVLLQASVHLVPDGLRLARVAARAHDEEVGVRADGPHVEDDHVAGELVLDERRDSACLFDRRQAAPVYPARGGYNGSRASSSATAWGSSPATSSPASSRALRSREATAIGSISKKKTRSGCASPASTCSIRWRGKPGRVATARRTRSRISSGSFHARKSANSSAPIRKTASRHSGWARSVSIVRACVSSTTSSAGNAARASRRRRSAGVSTCLWPGSADTRTTSGSISSSSFARRASSTWPRCGGSNEPP